jgi:hypothetical protein
MFRHIVLGVLACLSLTAVAEAAPRDEMLVGISRCTSISDERTFLDCVYGAAQPVRAELGLPPAPATQIRLVPGAGAVSVPLPPAGVAVAAPPPEESGGFLSFILGGKTVTPATAMASYSFDHNGHFIVTLANGQIWRQINEDTDLANWRKPASAYIVTVTTGVSEADNLKVTGEPGLYRVTRVRR